MNEKLDEPRKFSLFKELVFMYNYVEYLQRYLFKIYPKLRKNKLVITDRYFYDIYGQYAYATKSILAKSLFKIYPKPNYLFVLDAKTGTIMRRNKDAKMFSNIKKSAKRGKIDMGYIKNQKKRYDYLKDYLNAIPINTERNINENVSFIINKSWIKIVK